MSKKLIKIILSIFFLFGIVYYIANLKNDSNFTQGVFASNPPAVVDIKLQILSDGTSATQAFDTTANDNSALTNPGDDQNANNSVVRAGDSVQYRISMNALNMDTTDTTAVVTLDNGRWTTMPAVCLTTITYPPVSSSNSSSISSDGRTIICNTGIIKEGSATFIDLIAISDYAPNDTKLNATAVASSQGATNKTATPVQLSITSRPSVDLVMYHDFTGTAPTQDNTQAYLNSQCLNAGTITPSDNGVCALGVLGDVLIYKFKLQHSRFGDSRLSGPLNATFTSKMVYTSAAAGIISFSPTLVGCAVVGGVSSGSVACSTDANLADNSYDSTVTLTGVDDNQTGSDGKTGDYSMKYFIPRASYQPVNVYTLTTSNIISNPAFDPVDTSGVSNYGASDELTSTCDSTTNTASVACNNRDSLPVAYPTAGVCTDKTFNSYAGSQGTFSVSDRVSCSGLKTTVSNTATTGEVVPVELFIGTAYNDQLQKSSGVDKILACDKVDIDGSGNPLYGFTGNGDATNIVLSDLDVNGLYTSLFTQSSAGGVKHSTYAQWNNPSENYALQHAYTKSILDSLLAAVTLEYSDTPIVNPRTDNCDNGVWYPVDSNYNVIHPNTNVLTKFRVTINKASNAYNDVFPDSSSYFQTTVKMLASVPTLLAHNGGWIQNYSNFKFLNSSGQVAQPFSGNYSADANGWINTQAPALSANPTPAEVNAFRNFSNADLTQAVPANIRVFKTVDKVNATSGDTLTFTVTPSFYGSGTANLTVTDIIPSTLTVIPSSLPSICTLAGATITCKYSNAVAGTTLSPATISYKTFVNLTTYNTNIENDVVISSDVPSIDTVSCISDQNFRNRCMGVATVYVRTPGSYYVEKELKSPQEDEVNQDIKYDLRIKNVGSQSLGVQEYIEVFPFNGDSGNYTKRVSNPDPSNFSGTLEYKGIILPAGVTITAYTTDAPGTIKLDPKCKSNTSSANWIDGNPTISATNTQGTDWVNYCGGTDTATNWTLGSTPPANATAIKFSSAALAAGATTPVISLTLHAKNNHGGDRYTNNFSGRSTSIDLPVVSNDVSSTVLDGSIADRVWNDIDKDGVQDAGEPGFNNVPITVTWFGLDGVLGGTDDMTFTATTDSNGNYKVDYLPSGNYSVTVTTPPVGFGATYDLDGIATLHTVNTTLAKTVDATGSVTSVQDRLDVDFGYAGYMIQGDVWVDINKDSLHGVLPTCGIADPLTTECGIPSVTVTLNDATTGATVQTVITDGLGHYKFTNIPNGTYNVVQTQPNAYTSQNANIMPVTVASLDLTGKDFSELPGQMSGYVYIDANNNGIRDAGELPVAAATIVLTGNDVDGNVVNQTTPTDALGYYSFANLRAGNFTITETQPAAPLVDGKDTAGTTGGVVGNDVISNISLSAGANSQNNNFGEINPAKLGDFVWEDTNANGIQDAGEPGISGAIVTLTDNSGNPVVDALGVTVAPITTPATGLYQFTNLIPGTYKVNITLPTNYVFTTKDTGLDTKDSDVDTVTGTTSTITLTAGQTNADLDVGAYKKVSVGDYVWNDKNKNGIQEAGEPGIDSVTVELRDSTNTVVQTKITTGGGKYLFTNVIPGVYTVKFTKPLGLTTTLKNVGAVGTDSDADLTTGVTGNITLVSGVDNLTIDAGYYGYDISGDVWVDINKDNTHPVLPTCGTADPLTTECGLGSVTLELKDATNTIIQTVVTDTLGHYKFTNIPDGTYTVVETQPAGFGTENPNTMTIVVTGADLTGKDFSEIPSEVSGYVYEDTNDNGTKDTLEPGIPNATVKIIGTDVDGNPVSTSVTTDSTGKYTFSNLRKGTFTVTELQPIAYADGKDTAGSTGGTVSNDMISSIPVNAGSASTDNNFGEKAQSTAILSGVVWEDTNGDGVLDNTEVVRVAGVTITVTDTLGTLVGTTQTDSNGYYQMIVNPGSYLVVETQPANYGSTTPNTLLVVVTTDSPNHNYGENKKSSIQGFVYIDKNDNGVKDAGENGIIDTIVTLTNGVSVKTNSAGAYAIGNLVAGTYEIIETQPSYADGKDTAGTSGGVVTNDKISTIVLGTTTETKDNNFGELAGSLSGTVYIDKDKSGTQNTGEVGMAGVVVNLKDVNGVLVAKKTTDVNGDYKFSELPIGSYTVVEEQPAGYISTTPDTLTSILTSAKRDVNGVSYGEVPVGKIVGVVWNDSNKNGVKEPLETAGIANAVIEVRDSSDKLVATVTTGNTGNYEVGNLEYGTYKVTVKQPSGWTSTTVEVLGATVSAVDAVANYGAVMKIPDTGADYGLMMLGMIMMGLAIVGVLKVMPRFKY